MKTQWREFEGKVANYLQSFVLLYFKAFFSIKNEKLNFKKDELKPYILVSKNFLNLEQRKRKLNFYLVSSNLCSKIQWLKVNCSNFIVITYLFFNCKIMVHTQKKISVGLKNYFYKSSMLMFVRSWDNLAQGTYNSIVFHFSWPYLVFDTFLITNLPYIQDAHRPLWLVGRTCL